MSFTPEYEIFRDYVTKRRQIENSVKAQTNEAWKQNSLDQLKELYAILLAKREQKIKSSLSLRLKTLQKRLENIFELLNLWNQYVEVIYMPEAEVHMIDQLSQMEGRDEDYSYAQTMERDDVTKRLKMLFKPEDEDSQGNGDFDAAEALNEAYETVNEGETTDTTSGIDEDGLIERTKPKSAQSKEADAKAKASKKDVEEGIKSSDDEEDQASQEPT